jgi:hypothetical protein
MTLGKRVKRFARNKLLGDPSFELDDGSGVWPWLSSSESPAAMVNS